MRHRKKVDPNALKVVRDNGLPERPPELAVAQKSLQELLGGVNVATGYGLHPSKKGESCWLLFVFTDDRKLQVPDLHEGFPVRRTGVPRPL